MARLFISHSSANNAAAIALVSWLSEQGYDDVFLDIHPERGLAAGERWQEALKAAADRCEAVLILVSPAWLASKWCLAEFLLAKSLHKRIFGLVVEPVPLGDLPAEMTAEWQLCELVGEDRQRSFEVEIGARRDLIAFREAGLDLLRRGLERAGLDARSFPWPPFDDPNRPPYHGLVALEEKDAAIFFGRDAWIVRGLDRMRGLLESGVEKFLVILGGSGSGKSSFLRAGLWPRLARDDALFLPLPIVRPERRVITGSSGLAVALATAFERLGSVRPPGLIKEALAQGAEEFGKLLDELSLLAKRRLVAIPHGESVPVIMLALDQAEELFNSDGAQESVAFLELLAGLLQPAAGAPARKLLIVATMRSDRYELLQAEPRLQGIKQDLFNLPPMPVAEFKSVIEGPARRVVERGGRLSIDPALTERLVADAQGADALPLLAFTLERLYADYGGSGKLTLAEYEKLGGVQGSIEAAIERALGEPDRQPTIPNSKDAQLACLRAAFIPWLARFDSETNLPMRRVARLDEIPSSSRALVQRLVRERLLVADQRAGVETIEVAHEALLRQWLQLRGWLDEEREFLIGKQQLEQEVQDWQRAAENQKLEALLSGLKLTRAREWLVSRPHHLTDPERKFVQASIERHDAEAARRESARRRVFYATAAALLAATVLGGFSTFAWVRAERHRAAAEQSHAEAESQRERAQERAAEAHEQRNKALLSVSWRLADMADKAFARNDPVSAMLLALEGLPGQSVEEDRPYVAALESILYQAGTVLRELPPLGASQVSHDKRRIAAGDDEGKIVIYDIETAKPLVIAEGHSAKVMSLRFAAKDAVLASGCADGTARIWDPQTGKSLQVLNGEEGPIENVMFADQDRILITTSESGTIRLWNVADGRLLVALQGHRAQVRWVDVRPTIQRAVSYGEDGAARLWDLASGREIARATIDDSVRKAETNSSIWAYLSADHRYVLVTISTGKNKETALIWDSTDGREIGRFGDVSGASFVSKTGLVYMYDYDRARTRLFDPASARMLIDSFDSSFDYWYADHAVLWSKKSAVAQLWDLSTGLRIAELASTAPLVAVNVLQTKRVFTAALDGTIAVWKADTGELIRRRKASDHKVISALGLVEGTRLLIRDDSGLMQIWDTLGGSELARAQLKDKWGSAEYGRKSTRIATLKDDGLRVWDVKTGVTYPAPEGSYDLVGIRSLAIDYENGAFLAAVTGPQSITIWEVETGKKRCEIKTATVDLHWPKFSPDAGKLMFHQSQGTMRLWETGSCRELGFMAGAKDFNPSFTAKGNFLLQHETDRALGPTVRTRWWRADETSPMTSVRLHGGVVKKFAFWGDLKHEGMLGVLSENGAPNHPANLYDSSSGKLIRQLGDNKGRYLAARFMGEDRLVIQAADETRIWDQRNGKTLAAVDSKYGSSIGRRFLVVKTSASRIQVWNIAKAELGYELEGISENVKGMLMSSEDRYLATWTWADVGDGRLWDLATGSEIKFFRGAIGFLFSADEERAFVRFKNGSALLIETKTGRTITELPSWDFAAFSPDSSCFLVVVNKTARLLNAATGALRTELQGAQEPQTAAMATGCRLVAIKKADGTLSLWSGLTGAEIRSPAVAKMSRFATVAEGRQLVFWGNDKALLVDSETGAERPLEGQREAIITIRESKTAGTLLTVSRHEAQIWDVSTGRRITALQSPDAEIQRIAFSPDGTQVAMVTDDRGVRISDAHTGAAVATLQFADHESPLPVFSEAGVGLLVMVNGEFAPGANLVRRFGRDGEIESSFRHRNAVAAIAVSPDAERMLVATNDQKLTAWDFMNARELAKFDGAAGIASPAISPDLRRFAAAFRHHKDHNRYTDVHVRLWDGANFRQIAASDFKIKSSLEWARAYFTSDSRHLVVIAEPYQATAKLFVFEAESGRLISEQQDLGYGGKGEVLIGHTAKYLLLQKRYDSADGIVWDVAAAKRSAAIPDIKQDSLATFSPDDKRIAVVRQKEIEIWDTATGKLQRKLSGHSQTIQSIVFSPNGRELISGSYDATVRIWNVESGEVIRTLTRSKNPFALPNKDADSVRRLRISPAADRIATESDRIALWNARTGEEIAAFAKPQSRELWAFSPGGSILHHKGFAPDLLFRVFATTSESVLAARKAVPRCMSLSERNAVFLDPEPPLWCVEMRKWPYHSRPWSEWLNYKRAKLNPPLPDTPEWQPWLAARVPGRGASRLPN